MVKKIHYLIQGYNTYGKYGEYYSVDNTFIEAKNDFDSSKHLKFETVEEARKVIQNMPAKDFDQWDMVRVVKIVQEWEGGSFVQSWKYTDF
jgi:hypothetical protein